MCDCLGKLELKMPVWTIDWEGASSFVWCWLSYFWRLLSQIWPIWTCYLLGRVASPEEIEGPCCPSPNSQHSHRPFSSWQMTMIRIAGRWVLKWMRARWVAHRVMSNLHWPWVRPGYELKRYHFALTNTPKKRKESICWHACISTSQHLMFPAATQLQVALHHHLSRSHPMPEAPEAAFWQTARLPAEAGDNWKKNAEGKKAVFFNVCFPLLRLGLLVFFLCVCVCFFVVFLDAVVVECCWCVAVDAVCIYW